MTTAKLLLTEKNSDETLPLLLFIVIELKKIKSIALLGCTNQHKIKEFYFLMNVVCCPEADILSKSQSPLVIFWKGWFTSSEL